MGTNEIVTDIIDCFIHELKDNNLIKQGFIKNLEELLHSNEKVTTQKIEILLYEENDEL
ncbi:hypothetical protein Lste_0066 [Legionella steelei]|uniref:Uncharacterized protein n=1 Tax=Legionella steelei TaxID=947033 RepID=A0A0W0ZRF2_9GAMM|nr:hypothetical protein [Legionella steelei]KTD71781.1 hypothetical protein Lste_0066 [Legionella steelei]